MNILVLNGSPKSEKSNTYQITAAFLDGLNSNKRNSVDVVDISTADIGHCLGCYTCWTKTPGQCVMRDDMPRLIEKYINAELVIWSFPLYYYGMPSKTKAFLDRLLPTNLPAMDIYEDKTSGHPSRYDLSHQRHILISTCGFYSIKGNYDGLFAQFEIMFHDKLTKIICPEGELFRVPELSSRIEEYLSHVKKAGEEYLLKGGFSQEVQDKLSELLYPPEVFVEMANADWEIAEISSASESAHNAPKDTSYPFLRQMAALYNPDLYKKDIVLEMHFTDLDKTFQLLLGKEKCTVTSEHFTAYTTRIETPFQTWLEISEGKINGAEAMMNGLYKVLGDLETMIKLDDFFSPRKPVAAAPDIPKNSSMILLLLPFLAMWLLMPFDYVLGSAAGILAGGLVCILHFWFRPTPYERIGVFSATFIGLVVMVTGGAAWQLSMPYFVSCLLWLSSAFMRIPITAYYSCKDYGGEKAYDIPLFIRTNRILSALWGIAYLLLGVMELLAVNVSNTFVLNILIWTATGFLGLFTAWFAKWYPARIAGGSQSCIPKFQSNQDKN